MKPEQSKPQHVSIHITLTDDTGTATRLLSWVKVDKVTLPIMAGGLLAEMREAVADVRLDAPKPDPGALHLAPGATPADLWHTVYDPDVAARIFRDLGRACGADRLTYSVDYIDHAGRRQTHRWTEEPTTRPVAPPDICATEAPRDVATDPRVGDRVKAPDFARFTVVGTADPGPVVVEPEPWAPLTWRDALDWRPMTIPRDVWADLCRTPGAVIERAPE